MQLFISFTHLPHFDSLQVYEMIFVIDSSKSVNQIPGAFNDAKKFVLDIISNFDIGPNPTQSRVGIIIYGTEASVRLDLRKSGQIGGDGVKTWIQGKSE